LGCRRRCSLKQKYVTLNVITTRSVLLPVVLVVLLLLLLLHCNGRSVASAHLMSAYVVPLSFSVTVPQCAVDLPGCKRVNLVRQQNDS
jgi:uncharacterized membrane protein YkgB